LEDAKRVLEQATDERAEIKSKQDEEMNDRHEMQVCFISSLSMNFILRIYAGPAKNNS
jgi:hypothetical protein